MRKTRLMFVAFAALALAATALAGEPITSLRCHFLGGISAEIKDGGFEPETAGPMTFTFVDIDLDAGTARMVGNIAVETISVSTTPAGFHFLDITDSGNLIVTTAFVVASKGPYPAVHSRHVNLLGEALPSQYYGTCRGLQ